MPCPCDRSRASTGWTSGEHSDDPSKADDVSRSNATRRPFGPTAKARLLELPNPSDAIPGLVVTLVCAVWAARTGTLPGQGLPVFGPAIQGVIWACLYFGLGLTYGRVAPDDRGSVRRVFRRLGVSIPLALLATRLCRLLLEAQIASTVWAELFYPRWLLPLAFVGLWCAALLPRETRGLARAALAQPEIAPLPQLAVLVVSAAILVSCADLAFAFQRGGGAVQARLSTDDIWVRAWVLNVLILFSAYALVFAVTRRVATALLSVSPLYAVLGLATLAKIKYMHSAVQPLDLLRLPEFLPLFRSFFGRGAVAAAVVGLGVWVGALAAAGRIGPCRMSVARRYSVGLLSIAALGVFPAAILLARSFPGLSEPLHLSGVPTGQQREQARRHGFLLSFIAEVPSAFVTRPPNYSPATVARALSGYWQPGVVAPERSARGRVNLIIYMVESLMDPNDLGVRYTSDPIPNLQALREAHAGGYVIVPGRFGGSADTEFEALTGMATAFLPQGSVPYRQYLKRRIPSLPYVLKALGYTTTAIQADPRYYYDRERVYGVLGFDSVMWLRGAPGVERASRGEWPSDQAVVKAVIRASQVARPFFIFAFPSSTHGPYNSGTYQGSVLDVLGPPDREAAAEVKEYINTLRVADDAIGTLIQYFSRQSDSTVIAILGDHLPPLSAGALRPFFTSLSGLSEIEQARMTHRVPLLVWANFDAPGDDEELGVNMLPSYLLEKLGIAPPGFLAVTDAARRELPVLESYVKGVDGQVWNWESVPADKRALIDDYRLLQYDVLLGEQHSVSDSSPQQRVSTPAR